MATTRQAIANATAFDARDVKGAFDDNEAYREGKRDLGRLVATGQLRLDMKLAVELMRQGSRPVEMSDDSMMTEDVKDCLGVVLEALPKCDLRFACCRRDRLVFGDARQ